MLKRLHGFSQQTFITGILAACATAVCATPAASQILPEVWGTVGSVDDLVSYGAGVRFAGTGNRKLGREKMALRGQTYLTFVSFSRGITLPRASAITLATKRSPILEEYTSARLSIVIGWRWIPFCTRCINGKLGFQILINLIA